MKEVFARDVAKICDGQIIMGKEEEVLKEFMQDTRKIKEGDVYIGFKGERNDGNLMYEKAFENGAKVCILEKNSLQHEGQDEKLKELQTKYNDRTIILVNDTKTAIQKIASYKRSLYDIPVIGITGSVGKTSTKDIIASVMARKFKVLKTQGNQNNQIGLPLTVLKLTEENDAMVVEMGMNMPGEISNLSKIANPTVAVITNVGTAHIGNLGSRENILKAKLEILDGLRSGGTLIINNDNDMLHKWNEERKGSNFKVITFGMENKSDIMPYDIVLSENGSTYKIDIDGKTYQVNVSVGGNHFVLNSLCAIAIGRIFQIDMQDILKGIASFELTKRRMQVEKNKAGVTIINDCYNANYDSMKAAIEYLGKINAGKKIAVLGDMLELGEFSDELHEKVGEEIARNKINVLITVGDLAKNIAKKAKEQGLDSENIFECEKNSEAVEMIKQIAKKGDAVLLKASNGMNFQEIFDAICCF